LLIVEDNERKSLAVESLRTHLPDFSLSFCLWSSSSYLAHGDATAPLYSSGLSGLRSQPDFPSPENP
jgi:hypothetical protein